jgi:hypothetical protein
MSACETPLQIYDVVYIGKPMHLSANVHRGKDLEARRYHVLESNNPNSFHHLKINYIPQMTMRRLEKLPN